MAARLRALERSSQHLTSYADCEPLLDDHRMRLVEDMVRIRHPSLPDESVFVTARVGDKGHFILLSPVPGIPDPFRMQTVRRVPISTIERFEKERGHYVTGGSKDPAYWVFEELARDQTNRLAGAAEMIHPENSLND